MSAIEEKTDKGGANYKTVCFVSTAVNPTCQKWLMKQKMFHLYGHCNLRHQIPIALTMHAHQYKFSYQRDFLNQETIIRREKFQWEFKKETGTARFVAWKGIKRENFQVHLKAAKKVNVPEISDQHRKCLFTHEFVTCYTKWLKSGTAEKQKLNNYGVSCKSLWEHISIEILVNMNTAKCVNHKTREEPSSNTSSY